MEIYIYTGGHRTTSHHFYNALVKNNESLQAEKVLFSSTTRRTKKKIINAFEAIKQGNDQKHVRDNLLQTLTFGRDVKRLLIVDLRLFGGKRRAISNKVDIFYDKIQTVFKGCDIRFFIETRNYATYAASAYSESIIDGASQSFLDFLSNTKYSNFRWPLLIEGLQRQQNSKPEIVWRFEDYEYIWRDILGAFSGIYNSQDLIGPSNTKNLGLSIIGAELLNKYKKEYSNDSNESLEQVQKIFLRQYPFDQNTVSVGAWNGKKVQQLTNNYEDDWYYIDRIDNVIPLKPR